MNGVQQNGDIFHLITQALGPQLTIIVCVILLVACLIYKVKTRRSSRYSGFSSNIYRQYRQVKVEWQSDGSLFWNSYMLLRSPTDVSISSALQGAMKKRGAIRARAVDLATGSVVAVY